MIVRPTFALACYGTSLTAGRLSSDWVPILRNEIATFPEAKGPIAIYCTGHGGWTSVDLLNGAPVVAALRPTHILTEGGAINDCPDFGSGPAVSRATHNANNQAMINLWRASNPAVDITMMTMSSVSAIQTARTNLAAYYADELATAQSMGLRALDNYNGTSTVPGGWPKPLNELLTYPTAAFTLPLTPGYNGMIAAVTWNPNDSVGMTFSADKLTVTGTQSQVNGVRAIAPLSGKVHFEATIHDFNTSPYPALGVATPSASLTAILGGPGSIAVRADGSVSMNNNLVGSFPPAQTAIASGATVGVEIDTVAKKLHFLAGSQQSADFDVSPLGSPLFPVTTMANNGVETAQFSLQDDGLHPVWTGAVDTYLYPNIKAFVRARMAEFWS